MIGPSAGDRGRFLINVGLAAVVGLVVTALITSIYQQLAGSSDADSGFWQDPQIISLAIGLILSVLFVDRWRSLEGKVDSLSTDQHDKLKDIQTFAKDHIELQVGQVVDKAEKVSAKIASIAERHPWLEVITDRDMIVETESVRGILRTAYSMLKGGKNYLHLFEYLEYCARKGTPADPRKDGARQPLRGTADDFLEIASFCEIWLGDYALSAEFLKRYIERAGPAAYVMYPDYIRRLLRIGDMPAAIEQTRRLEAILKRDRLFLTFPMIGTKRPMSDRFRWHAANALTIAYSASGDARLTKRHSDYAHASPYAQHFTSEQALADADAHMQAGQFAEAMRLVSSSFTENTNVYDLRDRIVLLERMGAFQLAAELRKRLDVIRRHAFGDDHRSTEEEKSFPDARGSAPHETAKRRPTTMRERDPDVAAEPSLHLDARRGSEELRRSGDPSATARDNSDKPRQP